MDAPVPPRRNFFWTKVYYSGSGEDRELRVVVIERVHISLMHIIAAIIEKCPASMLRFSLMWERIFSHKFSYPILDPLIQTLDQWSCTECGKPRLI